MDSSFLSFLSLVIPSSPAVSPLNPLLLCPWTIFLPPWPLPQSRPDFHRRTWVFFSGYLPFLPLPPFFSLLEDIFRFFGIIGFLSTACRPCEFSRWGDVAIYSVLLFTVPPRRLPLSPFSPPFVSLGAFSFQYFLRVRAVCGDLCECRCPRADACQPSPGSCRVSPLFVFPTSFPFKGVSSRANKARHSSTLKGDVYSLPFGSSLSPLLPSDPVFSVFFSLPLKLYLFLIFVSSEMPDSTPQDRHGRRAFLLPRSPDFPLS